MPDSREGQVEKSEQNWKNVQFSRALKGNFYHLSFNGKNAPLSTILTPSYVFEQILKHSLNFEPLPHPISGINSEFDYATLCVLN